MKVARRATFDSSTSLSSAAGTCLRQRGAGGGQMPSVDGWCGRSRFYALWLTWYDERVAKSYCTPCKGASTVRLLRRLYDCCVGASGELSGASTVLLQKGASTVLYV